MNRTRTVKRIISCMITLALTAFFLHKISSVFVPKDTIDCKCQNELFYSLPKNSVEVIIYGSSHAYRGINPRELYEKYGAMLFKTQISKSVEAAKSSENGTPLCMTAHKLGTEYDDFAMEVLSRC